MRKTNAVCIFLLFVITLGFPRIDTVTADGWFASYGDISWEEEQAWLGSFAIALNRDPDMIGYIGFRVGKKDTLKKVKARIYRAKSFLIDKFKVEKSRIVIVNGGKDDETIIILQPVLKELPPPVFSSLNY